MDKLTHVLGSDLAAWRKERNLTIAKAAELAGVTKNWWWQCERGHGQMHAHTFATAKASAIVGGALVPYKMVYSVDPRGLQTETIVVLCADDEHAQMHAQNLGLTIVEKRTS